MVNTGRVLSALLGLGLLAGCATTHVPTDVEMTGMPNAEIALRRALDQVTGDMTQIGGMQPVSLTAATRANDPVVPGELQKPVVFIWNGSLDAGVRKLADSIGYTVAVIAPQNAQAVDVSVSVNGRVISALEALGLQAGTLATVRVDPLHRQVQVIHHV